IEIGIKQVNTKKTLNAFLQDDAGYEFNLSQELPIRVNCYTCNNDYYLSIVVHHIAFDGWSGDILAEDLFKYYQYYQNSPNSDDDLDLPDLPLKYQDFAIWQRNYLQSKAIQKQLAYWVKKLNGYESLNLPIDKLRPTIFDYRGKTIVFELPLKLSMQLRQCAHQLNISLYSLLLSGFYLLLKIYSNQNDVVLGTMIANRHYKNTANLVGFFVNAIVLRQQINDESSVIDFIQGVFNEVLAAQLNQDIPFEKIVDEVGGNSDMSRHPIFQVAFGIQHFGGGYEKLFTEYKTPQIYKTAKFDLSLIFNDNTKNRLVGTLEYATSIFELTTIKNYFKTYKIILGQLAQITHQKYRNKQIKEITYLNKGDYKKIIIDYNNTYREYSHDKTIHQLFEEQVEKTPDNIAVIYENYKLTYSELNQRANQLAHYIKHHYHICPDDLIGLFLNRSENILIGILAVLKSGGAYVPIDPNYPDGRIHYILEDTQVKVILGDSFHKNRLEQLNKYDQDSLPVLFIDDFYDIHKPPIVAIPNPQTAVVSNNLAYVIYTSGTTGNPKGVEIEHSSFVNTIVGIKETYFSNNHANTYSVTNYTFDIFGLEYALPLICGSRLCVGNLDFMRLDCSKYDFIQMTPSICNIKLGCLINTSNVMVLIGGERLEINLVNKLVRKNINYINLYGPTETTIWSLSKLNKSSKKQNKKQKISIGKPLPNQQFYILNSTNLNIVPMGAIGELYIGGASVARGYRNNFKLTTEKFVPTPFLLNNSKPKLYKTGDLVKLFNNGNVAYIGRNDLQIKIHGQRIELREIENALSLYTGIKQCVVTLKYKNNLAANYLVGYYIKEFQTNSKDSSQLITNWKNIYDAAYSRLDITDYKNNFIGWNSSYTGQPIPHTEMSEWREDIIIRIANLHPKRILEIGSGSGLLLFKLINNNCEHYYACDLSEQAIKYTKNIIASLGYSSKFTAFVSSADNIPFADLSKLYDTVILNSVIQYFPSLQYLEELILKVIDNIDTIGRIFIGDIRDFRLLECFAYSVLSFKNSVVDVPDIEYFKLKEKELLISPEYFFYLKNNNSYISSVELLPKLGNAINEMNCYRYDVILHINKKVNNSPSAVNCLEKADVKLSFGVKEITAFSETKELIRQIDSNRFKKVIDILNLLTSNSDEDLYIKYPNFRVAREYIKYKHLYNNECKLTSTQVDTLLNIEQLTKMFHQAGYKMQLYLDIESPLYLNIVASKRIQLEKIMINYPQYFINQRNFANAPMQNIKSLDNQYNEGLRKYLETKLPDYMIPHYLIQVNNIPLNSNGKIDYNLLPNPDFIVSDTYVAPTTDLEKELCGIFSQILNIAIDQIGIKDNFFKIGGNSILAIKLIAKINNQLKFKIKVIDVFIRNTVQSLATYLSHINEKFNLIANLNHVYDKLNIFMIHPAFAGAEVYTKLAGKLSDIYSCYGLDNYNLYHYKKIKDIKYIADFYLDAINRIRKDTNQENEPYVLLGWSLGGQIALNMAYILEQSGYTNIYLILIDSVYPDNYFAENLSQVTLDESRLELFARQAGFDPEYAAMVKNNFKYDLKLSFQEILIKLNYTKILLFKAMQKEAILFLQNYDPLKEYTLSLRYNNIDKVVNVENISLVKFKDSNHFNLLEQRELICDNIRLFMNRH
ncbi:MAG: amino acid adenylation domain-containing protein, partial [Burkholderiales bacterium]|nr:amino acid adenylation domain-containing protein [Burkholderiales bacterium]